MYVRTAAGSLAGTGLVLSSHKSNLMRALHRKMSFLAVQCVSLSLVLLTYIASFNSLYHSRVSFSVTNITSSKLSLNPPKFTLFSSK